MCHVINRSSCERNNELDWGGTDWNGKRAEIKLLLSKSKTINVLSYSCYSQKERIHPKHWNFKATSCKSCFTPRLITDDWMCMASNRGVLHRWALFTSLKCVPLKRYHIGSQQWLPVSPQAVGGPATYTESTKIGEDASDRSCRLMDSSRPRETAGDLICTPSA